MNTRAMRTIWRALGATHYHVEPIPGVDLYDIVLSKDGEYLCNFRVDGIELESTWRKHLNKIKAVKTPI